MFKFFKDKLKNAIKKFSSDVDEESEEIKTEEEEISKVETVEKEKTEAIDSNKDESNKGSQDKDTISNEYDDDKDESDESREGSDESEVIDDKSESTKEKSDGIEEESDSLKGEFDSIDDESEDTNKKDIEDAKEEETVKKTLEETEEEKEDLEEPEDIVETEKESDDFAETKKESDEFVETEKESDLTKDKIDDLDSIDEIDNEPKKQIEEQIIEKKKGFFQCIKNKVIGVKEDEVKPTDAEEIIESKDGEKIKDSKGGKEVNEFKGNEKDSIIDTPKDALKIEVKDIHKEKADQEIEKKVDQVLHHKTDKETKKETDKETVEEITEETDKKIGKKTTEETDKEIEKDTDITKKTSESQIKDDDGIQGVTETLKIKETKEVSKQEKKGFFGKLAESITTKSLKEEKFDDLFFELEIVLMENNVAIEVIEKIKNDLKENLVNTKIKIGKTEEVIMQSLTNSIEDLFSIEKIDLIKESKKKKPYIILFVGVNGVGKTTTIAKFAKMLENNGLSCVMAAGDTFRAAAIQQLEEHAKILGKKLIKHDYGSDPSAVAYDAIKYAEAKDIDVVLIDTAGRQHSNSNLMEEMKKMKRVANPDFKIFVGESITGNDCIEQAQKFNETVGIDGIILSKADVDEKGGTAISISYVTQKPILYIGTGQGYDNLSEFNPDLIFTNLGLK